MGDMTPKIYEYRLLDTATGLYSCGGTYNKWHSEGKVWRKINHIKCHITNWRGKQSVYDPWSQKSFPKFIRDIPKTWVIVKTTYSYINEEVIKV